MNMASVLRSVYSMRILGLACYLLVSSCDRDVTTFNKAYFTITFSPDQERLNNFGEPVGVAAGHAAQSPEIQYMSVHYIELMTDSLVPYKDGITLFSAPETNAGGAPAIDFDQAILAEDGVSFANVQLSRIPPGTYTYIRASVAYQQYAVSFNIEDVPVLGTLTDQQGIIASFVGYNTYISTLTIDQKSVDIDANKLQGFWGFESQLTGAAAPYSDIYTGQSPAGATTVVNPIHATSPIPSGSCVITGRFDPPLIVEEGETRDLDLVFSFSTNQSFEWVDDNTNGIWDINATTPESTEQVVDMGLRGLIPTWEWKE